MYFNLNFSKKRWLFLLCFLLLGSTNIWAFSFQPAPLNPLFREPLADPFAKSSSFRLLGITDDSGVPNSVLVANNETKRYEKAIYKDSLIHNYWQMKSAINIGLLRLSLNPSIEVEGYINGGLNTVFQQKGSVDSLGFDGMYGAGITVKLLNFLVVQAGFNHFSGHWGDEILANLLKNNPDLDYYNNSSTYRLTEYTRGNSWMAGASLEPVPWGRIYVFAELPMKSAWIRPGIHVPSTTIRPGSDNDSQFDHITSQEGLSGLTPPGLEYQALRLQGGIELRHMVSDIGALFFALDLQAHQDGQTQHQVGQYNPDNLWEVEYTIGGGLEINQSPLDRKVRIECYYHNGRFPLLNYFFQRSKYFIFGLTISN